MTSRPLNEIQATWGAEFVTDETPGAREVLRPARRTDAVIVREVGDELVTYALDTRQVTALDPVTATVWNRLDGTATIDEIVSATNLDEVDVCLAVDKLDRAGLMAGGVDRRRFMQLATALAGTASLMSITAPAAMAAGSNPSITLLSSCVRNGVNGTPGGTITGFGFAPGPVSGQVAMVFSGSPALTVAPVAFTTTADPNGVLAVATWAVPSKINGAGGRTYTAIATVTGSSATSIVTATCS
jgi:hypothetical protein